ncbi:hypothetical protein BH09ACT1_BH09ACT1_00470 [soil metagenome]
MQTTAPQPTRSRVLSIAWFPFFFAAAFSVMLLLSFASPTPHTMKIGVVGSASERAAVQSALDHVQTGGFTVTGVADDAAATTAIRNNELAAVWEPGTDASTLLAARAAGAPRVTYLTAVFTKAVVPNTGVGAPTVRDVVPVVAGDASGVSIFFYGLPVLIVGMIASITLLQFGMWPMRKKVALIAAVGITASVATWTVATAVGAIPVDGWLLLYAFILTQAIGWLTTGIASFVKQYFVPVAMTFVLIIGIPTAGATVSADMLPGFMRWLDSFVPFAQFIDIARASLYFDNHGLVRPLLILIGWALLGAVLVFVAAQRGKRAARSASAVLHEAQAVAPSNPVEVTRVHGSVLTTSGAVIAGASVLLVDDDGREYDRARSGADGSWSIAGVTRGLHHVVVTAPHCEPEIATIAVHGGDSEPKRDFRLLDWNDAAGNLTDEEIDSRWALARH